MSKFKVGDKIRRVSESGEPIMLKGSIWNVEATAGYDEIRLVNDPWFINHPNHDKETTFPWCGEYYELVEETTNMFYIILRNENGKFSITDVANALAKAGMEMSVSEYTRIEPTVEKSTGSRAPLAWRYEVVKPDGLIVRPL